MEILAENVSKAGFTMASSAIIDKISVNQIELYLQKASRQSLVYLKKKFIHDLLMSMVKKLI